MNDVQWFALEELSALSKMWVSFIGIGLMVISALIISFARAKTKGWLRLLLTIIAFVMLVFALLYAFIAIA